jgi:hypothetical protein
MKSRLDDITRSCSAMVPKNASHFSAAQFLLKQSWGSIPLENNSPVSGHKPQTSLWFANHE